MPTYQYRCVDCGSELEAVQKFTDASLTECPTCEGSLRKVYSAVGVVFKGSGFYATDNRTKGKTAAAAAGSSGDKPSEKSSEKSSSTDKPASTAEKSASPAKASSTSAA